MIFAIHYFNEILKYIKHERDKAHSYFMNNNK